MVSGSRVDRWLRLNALTFLVHRHLLPHLLLRFRVTRRSFFNLVAISKDKEGDRAVHHASFADESRILDLLSSAGMQAIP